MNSNSSNTAPTCFLNIEQPINFTNMRRSKRVKRSSPSVNTKEELDDLSKANDSLEEAELVHKNAQLAANAETDAPKTKPDTVNSDEKIADGASEDEIPTSAGHYGTQAVHSVPGGYNSLKTFNGQYYTGMAVGQSHMWHYEPGVWTETKREPDLWDINYKTNKRRARNAPEGSGAPVGTEYHWMIIGHQVNMHPTPPDNELWLTSIISTSKRSTPIRTRPSSPGQNTSCVTKAPMLHHGLSPL